MIFTGIRLRIALIVIGGFLVFGCARESVIAKVNGEAITKKDIKALLAHAGIKDESKIKQDGAHNAMRQELINQLINEKLLLQAANKENIKVDKKEVMRKYNDMIKAFPKEEDYLKKLKAPQGIKVHDVYVTFGRYDGVIVFEAPDVKAAMNFVMETGFATDYTVETLTAIPAKEL